MSYLTQQLTNFLRGGGEVSIVVGIDLLNTTREGLEALLALEPHGCCETYVYHNEAQSVFHPKLYLFRNEEEARLIVGSNNITEAGLYVNVEAGLQTDVPVNSPTIVEVVDALASWKDTATGLSFRLDAALLNRLVTEGYVPDEATARAQLRRVRQRQGAGRDDYRYLPPGLSPHRQPRWPRALLHFELVGLVKPRQRLRRLNRHRLLSLVTFC
jgi:hypothetical protein